jgi:hypothetical protein
MPPRGSGSEDRTKAGREQPDDQNDADDDAEQDAAHCSSIVVISRL